jgi:hypothetical protein
MAPADLVRPALMSVRPFADAESQIDLPSFQDAMATLIQFMLQKLQEGNRSAAPVLYVDQPRILRRRRPSNPIGVGKSDATAIKTSVSDSGDDQAENVRGLSSLATAMDSLPVGKTAAVASSDDEQPEPYDPSLPSLCILSTRDGGAQLRHVSGMNLPAHLAVGYTKGLASKVVARLLADGFTLKSTSTGSTPSELTFTFMRDVTLGQPSQPSQPASPPVSASMQSQPNSATVHDVSVGQQSQPASQPTQLGSTEAGNEVTSSAAGVAGVGGQAVETYRPLHPSPPVRTAATSVAEETNSSETVKRRTKKKRDSVEERRPVPLAVKGLPLSDAVALPARFEDMAPAARSDLGGQLPERFHAYDAQPNDRQPGVHAADPHAHDAAIARPGSAPVAQTTEWEDANVEYARTLSQRLRDVVAFREQKDLPAAEERARDDAADERDVAVGKAARGAERELWHRPLALEDGAPPVARAGLCLDEQLRLLSQRQPTGALLGESRCCHGAASPKHRARVAVWCAWNQGCVGW